MTEQQEMLADQTQKMLPDCIKKIKTNTVMQDIVDRDIWLLRAYTFREFKEYYESLTNIPDWGLEDIPCMLWHEGNIEGTVFNAILIKQAYKQRKGMDTPAETLFKLELSEEQFKRDLDQMVKLWRQIRRVVKFRNPDLTAAEKRPVTPWTTVVPKTPPTGFDTYIVYNNVNIIKFENRPKVKRRFLPSYHYINLIPSSETNYLYTVAGKTFRFLAVERDYKFIVDISPLIKGEKFVWPANNDVVVFPRHMVEQLREPLFEWMRENTKKNYQLKYWKLSKAEAAASVGAKILVDYEDEDEIDAAAAITSVLSDLIADRVAEEVL